MTPAEFDARLHDLLDGRSDPLDDAECVTFLARHPERLEALALLRERLAVLPSLVPSRRPRRRAAAVATVLLAAAVTIAAVSPWPWNAPSRESRLPGRFVAATSTRVPLHPEGRGDASVRSVLLARNDAHLEVFTRW